MIIKVTEHNVFESKELTPVVIFAMNVENEIFGPIKRIEQKYFPELSIKRGPNSLYPLIENEIFYIRRVIHEAEHGLEQIKGHDLTLIGIKCYSVHIGWGGTLPLVSRFIKESRYKEPVSFVWPKEVYLLDGPTSQRGLSKYTKNSFWEKEKIYPMFNAGVPIYYFIN